MCLILFAINKHPDYPLILIANRDEFYTRPSKPLHWWPGSLQLLGGQDLENGGSWFGLTREGRFAAVTNYREAGTNLIQRPSRGVLVRDYLQNKHPDWESWLTLKAQTYNGFNLLYGGWNNLNWRSNRTEQTRQLKTGIYGLSNNLLDTPWPKVERGKKLLQRTIQRTDFDLNDLLKVLQDDQSPPDDKLPDTGISLEWERLLSSIFIRSETYGTRASTVLLIDRQLQVQITERSWEQNGNHLDRHLQFEIES